MIGSTGLHARLGPAAREIGYWIGKEDLRRGYATEAVMALMRTGFLIENLNLIEIHCSEKNLPSMAIPARLGFHRQSRPAAIRTAEDDTVIWAMTRDKFSAMPYRYFRIKAYDNQGGLLDFAV